MTKRMIVWVMILALVLSFVPAVMLSAAAEGEETHTDHTGWTAWSDKTKLPTTAGKYYLTENVNLSADWSPVMGHTQLCLNGHTVTLATDKRIVVNAGRVLSIYDCATAYDADKNYTGGKIQGGSNSKNGMFILARGSSANAPGTVNIYGGRICGNRVTGKTAVGGAFYVQSGKPNAPGGIVNMYGGEITDNQAIYGSALALHGESAANRGDKPAQFNMYGGKIFGNTVTTGTIYAINDAIVNIQGGEIVDNTASSGSAIYAKGDNQVTLKNVEISGNTATNSSAEGNGSAVFVGGLNAKLILGGDVTVANNTNHANGCDIMLNNDAGGDVEKLYVDGLTAGVVRFAVKDTAVTEASQVVAFAGSDTGFVDGAVSFVSGSEEKYVGYRDGAFTFVEGHVHNGVLYLPWTDTTKLPSSGNYYLTDDVTVTEDTDRGTVEKGAQLHLCLNGKTVSGNNTVGRAFHVKDGSLYLDDCTTVYDAEGYFVSGGKITGWKMPGSGAALYADNAASVIEITGIEFSGNVNTGTNEDYGGGAIHLRENTTAVKVTGCLFEGNTAAKTGGGALHLRPRSKMTLDKCVITGNTAGSYGAAYARDAELTFNNCKITDNIATGGVSAVYVTGASTVTFHNTEVTGNQAQGTTVYGAVYAASSKAVMTLSGSTVITGNTVKDNKAQNVCLYNNSASVYDVSGLTEGANVGISLMPERISAGLMYFTTTGMTANPGYCVSDEAAYAVELDDSGRLALVDASSIVTHSHKLCGDESCTGHNAVSFKAWDKTDSLPTAGNWYLTAHVELTAAVTAEDLNLCLNGFTVTQKTKGQRILNVGNASNSVTVSLCDCQGTGVLTGGTATYGSAVSIRHKSTFNLFGGKLTGNTSTSEGTVYMQGNTPTANTFNMYGGEISGNTNRVGGAVSVGAPAAVTQIPTVNIYGGKIQGNTVTQSGGAIHASGALNLTIAGGEISGNTAATQGGAVNLGAGSKLNLTGGKITDNEAPKGAGIYANAKVASIAVSGDPVVSGNTASGKLNNLYLEGELVLTLGELDANASIGITAVTIGRPISSQTDKDYTANFRGDNSKMSIIYKENALWIDNRVETSDHYHCVCDGVKAGTCDHAEHMWVKWGDDDDELGTLPTTSGYYYLVSDVTMTAFAFPTQGQEIYLCLNGKTVTAAENDRHFNVSAGTVYTITDCALEMGGFTGGNRTFGGSVNINAGGTMNLYAGKFYGNNAPDSEGGAIYLQRATTLNGGVLNMYGGEISGNTAQYGAGIRAAGMNSGATGTASTVNIYGGLISDNHTGKIVKVDETTGKESVTYGHGGGIDTEVGSVLNIYGGTVSGNSSQYNGGGIHMVETTFLMEGGNISGNTAVNYGGGFFDSRGRATLKGGTISGNDATARGGAFVANGTVMDIYGVTVSGNTSKEGAVAYMNLSSKKVNGVSIAFPAQITVHDGAVFTGNKATANAGTFLVANPDVKLIIEGGEMTKNTAANGGAIMIWKGATVRMKGGKVYNNTVNLGVGGAVYASNDSHFVMEGGTISGNSARLGGAIYGDRAVIDLNGGSITGNTAKCKMTTSNGKQVKSGGQGAALYVQGTTLNIRGASITYNRAESNGGGVVMTQQAVIKNGVKTVYLAKTNMTGGTISYNYSGAAAGAMLIQSAGTVTNIYGGSFVGNECKATGGAIYVSTKSTLNMTGGTIRDNKSNNSGGGLYVAQGTANISNVTFQNNESVSNAAHLMVNGDQCVVIAKNCKFLEGKTKTAGALVQSKAHATFENCDFGNNGVNTGSGAGLYVSTRSYADLIGCKFYNNVSPNNAGALMLSNYAEVSVTGSDFTENSSDTLGGATYVSPAATLNLTDCTFNKCSSAGRGGAIACRGNINMTGCVVENCTAATEGGGIATDVNTMGGSGIMKGMVIKDTIIRNNTAGGQGGGIYGWKGCRLEIYDSQITGNTSPADGGAIWAYEDLELHNTKITGNTSGGEGYAVYMNDANYDGHSYMASKNKLSGNTIIRDNEGKNLYMGSDVVFAITGEGLGEDAYIELVLAEGYVTHQIQGAFHYEGGNREYIVTYGNRSVVDPEYDANLVSREETREEKKDDAAKSDLWLYVGVGAVALIVLAAVAVLILKKKKTPEATKE